MSGMKIGELSKRAVTNVPTIRYYEEIGLLPEPSRSTGGHRSYGDADVERLSFIRRCRDFGFSIDQVRSLVVLVKDQKVSCIGARDIVQAHLETVRKKLLELKDLENAIASFVTNCNATCLGGSGPECVIMEELQRPLRTAPPSSRSKRAKQ
ncbi:MerR family transcriptional regulator [Roseixanthobacter liquoris]|uniref:MerR family transcriptional regulator n=1 Tax=Roseixanthobacter liquoris TaxID=3119921 RepID=UPI00372C4094